MQKNHDNIFSRNRLLVSIIGILILSILTVLFSLYLMREGQYLLDRHHQTSWDTITQESGFLADEIDRLLPSDQPQDQGPETSHATKLHQSLNILTQTSQGQNITINKLKKLNEYHNALLLATTFISAMAMLLVFVQIYRFREFEELRKQFYQAQKMEAVGRLAGGIAHDFNNILASIIGHAEFLDEDLGDFPEQQGFARQIIRAGGQAQKLVDQILAFSRQSQTEMKPVHMIDDVSEIAAMLQATMRPGIKLRTIVEAEPAQACILANHNQVHQVIMNLCVNASDAITDSAGVITLQVCPVDISRTDLTFLPETAENQNRTKRTIALPQNIIDKPQGGTILQLGQLVRGRHYLSVIVEDTGSGMDRKTMERIFEPFYTTKTHKKGTGLGLSAVHGILAAHNGALVVDSTPGIGTKFEVIFPVINAPQNPAQELQNATDRRTGQGCVLLVEDEITVAMTFCRMLERLGYDVMHCLDPVEALHALQTQDITYDLIITDYKMPHMTGLAFAEKAETLYPHLPVILVSGYSEEKLQQAGQCRTVKAILKKPVRSDVLSKAIWESLKQDNSEKPFSNIKQA